jgi:hypothetical protein
MVRTDHQFIVQEFRAELYKNIQTVITDSDQKSKHDNIAKIISVKSRNQKGNKYV